MEEMLSIYKNRLTDLTARNRSLLLRRLTNQNNLDLHLLSKIKNGLSESVLEKVFEGKSGIQLLSQGSIDEESMILNKKIKDIKKSIDLLQQETGANHLYVTYGFMEGFLSPEFFVRCPILFFPVKLTKSLVKNVPYWSLDVIEEEEPFINKSLIIAIQKFRGINIHDAVQEKMQSIPKKLNEIIPFLIDLFESFEINLDFKQEGDFLSFFEKSNKEKEEKVENFLRFLPYSVLGKFQQSNTTLINDFNTLLRDGLSDGFLKNLLDPSQIEYGEIKEDDLDKTNHAENFFVLDTDASQESVVVASREKQGLIVHGPPGTGKSQVIVNLIVDRMMRGQKVLLVCQKPAALEVVYSRLGQLNLQQHVALVEDFNKDKQSVYKKMASIIEKVNIPTNINYESLSREKNEISNNLNKVAQSLHKVRDFKRSIYYLYGKSNFDLQQIFKVDDLLSNLTVDDLYVIISNLKVFIDLFERYDSEEFYWFNRKSFAKFSTMQYLEMKDLLKGICDEVRVADKLSSNMNLLFTPKYYLQNIQTVLSFHKLLEMLQNKDTHKSIIDFFNNNKNNLVGQLSLIKSKYASLQKTINFLKNEPSPLLNYSIRESNDMLNKLKDFQKMNKSIFKFMNKNWYTMKQELTDILSSHALEFPKDVSLFQKKLQSFLTYEKIRSFSQDFEFFSDIPKENNLDSIVLWFNKKEKVINFIDGLLNIQSIFPNWINNPTDKEKLYFLQTEFVDELINLLNLVELTDSIEKKVKHLNQYIQESQVKEYIENIHQGKYSVPLFEGLLDSLGDFENIQKLDQMKENMGDFEKVVLSRCEAKKPRISSKNLFDDWSKLIKNSFYHAWIEKIELKEPHLKDVSTETYKNNVERLFRVIEERKKSVPILLNKNLSAMSLNIKTPSKKLIKSESTKKRGVSPLRKSMEIFYDDAMSMIPCWLCTPDAVSAIFPLHQNMFDLVVFDEASQCPVENAIPSLYRAKQVVIAGDEKQLPPSSLFQSSIDDEDDEDDDDFEKQDKQAKSLLEWAKSRFPDKWLSWHYRSEYEELINFSNYAFYDKRIQISPTVSKNKNQKPIEFISVDGVWDNKSNRKEAEKIVEKVFDILLNDFTQPTIGIIAFNRQQADLIQDIFDEFVSKNPELQTIYEQAKTRKNGEEHVGLFVKNIENVQGDERDIVLFSIGYTKDSVGKMVSNFGPLSKFGGENRLNVAISRAKKKVVIVCSFEPSEWTRVETYSKGPRLLKKYLEYGKAISDNNLELAQSILNSLLDGTNINDEHNHMIFDSPFEQEVCEELKKLGYEVWTQVGFSGYRIDLAIIDPKTNDKFLLGVECDGATYHSSKIARERDIYRQRFLESKGWKIHRIWSRNWWINREREIEKIKQKIREIS